jgi:hypothetical protein
MQSFTHNHKETFQGVTSGNLTDQEKGPALQVHDVGKWRLREMHAQSNPSVVVGHLAGKTQKNVIPVTVDRQSFPAYPCTSWMSKLLQKINQKGHKHT